MGERPRSPEEMGQITAAREYSDEDGDVETRAHAEDSEREIIEGISITPDQKGEKKGEAALKEGVLGEVMAEKEGRDIDRDDPEVQKMAKEMSYPELNTRLEAERKFIDDPESEGVKSSHLKREKQLEDAVILKMELEGRIPKPE